MTFQFLSWITLLYITGRGFGLYRYFKEEVAWDKARDICSGYVDGDLAADSSELRNWIETHRKRLQKSWIGQYTGLTPWMYTKGCFSTKLITPLPPTGTYITNKTYVTQWSDIDGGMTQWSVGTCQRFCQNSNFFAIQNKKCYCLDLSMEELILLRVDDARCRYFCTSGLGGTCGGRDGVSVYHVTCSNKARIGTESEAVSAASPLCSVLDRINDQILPRDCSHQTHTACSKFDEKTGTITQHTYLSHLTTWIKARKVCRKNGAILPDTWLPSKNKSGVFWTGRFREEVVLSTDAYQKEDYDKRLSCLTMKFDNTVFNLVNRSCDEGLPFICKINSTEPLKSSDSTTMPNVMKISTTLHLTTDVNNGGNLTLESKSIYVMEDTTTTGSIIVKTIKKKPPRTIIIVIIFSCGFTSLIAVLLLFRKMRKLKKRKAGGVITYTNNNDVDMTSQQVQFHSEPSLEMIDSSNNMETNNIDEMSTINPDSPRSRVDKHRVPIRFTAINQHNIGRSNVIS